jgi:hypothetical protein
LEEPFLSALNVRGINVVRQREIHTAKPLVPEQSVIEFEMAIEKLKSHKSPDIDQIPSELIKTEVKQFTQIHELISSICNKEERAEEWKESIFVSIYKMDGKRYFSNYRGISLSSNMYIILSNILLSKLNPYAEEIIGGHQLGIRRNRSTTDQYSAFVKYLRKK